MRITSRFRFNSNTTQLQSWLLITFGVAALYVIGGLLVKLPLNSKLTNLFWPPAGFAFASLWWFGKRGLVGVTLGSLLVSIFISSNLQLINIVPVAFGAALEALAAVWWLRQQNVSDIFSDVESILKFILAAALLAPMLAATIGATTLWIGELQSSTFAQTWLAWWVGDSMGVLLVAPFLLSLPHFYSADVSISKTFELFGVALLLLWLWHSLFMVAPSPNLPPLSFVIMPLIIWVAARFNIAVLTSVLFILSFMAISSTSMGDGPFVRSNLHESIAYLYGFLGMIASIGLFLNVSINYGRRNMKKLIESHQALQASNLHLAEAQQIAKLGSWEYDAVADVSTGSDECSRIYGLDTAKEGGISVGDEFVHPEDKAAYLETVARAFIYPNTESSHEYRIIRPDGEIRVIHSQGKITYDENKKPLRAVGTIQDITEIKLARSVIERLAYYDELTGLPNRRLMHSLLEEGMEAAIAKSEHMALLFVDIDHFKTLNSTHGHVTGDLLIKEAANRIRQCIHKDAILARPGGDEFSVILPNLDKEAKSANKAAMHIAEEIRNVLATPFDLGDHLYHSSASIGAIVYPHNDVQSTLHEIVKQADTALSRAKHTGRNTICFFEPHMQEAVNASLRLEQDLREALDKNEFQLYLQSQFNKSGHIVGAECLLRWQHPEHGLMLPDMFIPVAESTGLIVTIGNWVLHQACTIIAKLNAAGSQVRISVNVSPRQFRQHDFVLQIKEVLESTGARPQQLVLEITESVVMENVEEVITRMTELKQMGIGFSIDDFGTGYSSLSYLKHLPLRELKIDKSFVEGLPHDRDDCAIVGSILALAQNLGLEVVAEGVETAGQQKYLQANGCQIFQGYLYSKPIAWKELITDLLVVNQF